jgi:hypothetical protein
MSNEVKEFCGLEKAHLYIQCIIYCILRFSHLWVLMCKLFVCYYIHVCMSYGCNIMRVKRRRIEKFFTLHNHKRISAKEKEMKFPFVYKLTLFLNQSLRITSKQHLRNSFLWNEKKTYFRIHFWFFFIWKKEIKEVEWG